MNKLFYFVIYCLIFFNIDNAFSQMQVWQPVRNVTHGYIDVNPTFATKSTSYSMNLVNWEFLAFERHSGTASKICVIKMDMNGQTDTLTNIINDGFINRNPALCYDCLYSTVINNALIVWETNKNGRWDIYARYYSSTSSPAWGNVFPIDITSYDKSAPKCIFLSGTNFALAYMRNNKIVYKELNGQTQVITYDTVLTSNDTSICRNPNLIMNNSYNKKYVTYERRKADNNYAIYIMTSGTLPTWQSPDTVAYVGNNRNSVFITYNYNDISSVFESNRNGKWNIYCTDIPYSGSRTQDTVIKSNIYNVSNFSSFMYPIITDAPYTQAFSYVRKSTDSTKIIFGSNLYNYYPKDSTTIGDSSKSVKAAMNLGVMSGFDAVIWTVFNKDSLTYSNLYARKVIIIIGDIKKIGNTVPDNYELSQNYPNPFNPSTNIKFNIPLLSFPHAPSGNPLVVLKVYNILGKEISTLVNEKLSPGMYETKFSNNQLPSGIYFYTLTAGKFTDTKRMILIK